MKKTEEKLTTKNGIPLRKEDIQKAFSVLKSILLSKGVGINTSLTGVNTKDGSIVKIFKLIDEYALAVKKYDNENLIKAILKNLEYKKKIDKLNRIIYVLSGLTMAGWGAFLFLYFRG